MGGEFLRLTYALRDTELWGNTQVQPDAWSRRIIFTQNFAKVIAENESFSVKQYLRPLNWIVSYCPEAEWNSELCILLAITPYEANQLIPLFRSGSVNTRLHMFAARLHVRDVRQSTLFHSAELILPPACTPALPYSEMLDPELLVFSGSLYFESAQDENTYYCFLGFILSTRERPAHKEQRAAL